MNAEAIVFKYEEAAKTFEELPRLFTEAAAPVLLLHYDSCISKTVELFSVEEEPILRMGLENILAQIKWQQKKIRDAFTSDAAQATKSQGKRASFKDPKSEYRLEVIKQTKRPVISNGLSDIVGLDNVKTLLKKSVLLPMTFPNLFIGGRKAWNRILLYGPPGTGKSQLALALAAETKAELYSVSSADLLSAWIGESEKMIKDLFEFTRKNKEKSILFIDEIDGICRKRTAKEGDHTRSVKNQLLIELEQESPCVVLCATNCPWDIDTAFLRRFQCRIYVPLPDSSMRIKLIRQTCRGISVDLSPEEWKLLGDKTDGYSGADIVHLTHFALQEPLGDLENNHKWIVKNDRWMPCASNAPDSLKIPLSLVPADKVEVRAVEFRDFLKAVEATRKTITPAELAKYDAYL